MVRRKEVGKITHYYGRIGVGVISVLTGFNKGDTLLIGKQEPYLKQKATSMQRFQERVQKTRKGQEIGLKVRDKVRVGDRVFKVI